MRIGQMLPRKPDVGTNRETPRPQIGLVQYLPGEPFATSEQVLLSCFGLVGDASGTRSPAQLRTALIDAGFRGTAARHLIRTSPLLRRTATGQYHLREFVAS
jgi:hypothetical protein